MGSEALIKNRKYLEFEKYRIRFFDVTEAHAIYGRKILRKDQDCGWYTKIARLLFKIPLKCSVFFLHLLYTSCYNEKSQKSKNIKALYHFWGQNNNIRNKIL